MWWALSRTWIIGGIFLHTIANTGVYPGIFREFVNHLDNRVLTLDEISWRVAHLTGRWKKSRVSAGDRIISTGLRPPRSPDFTSSCRVCWRAGCLTILSILEGLERNITNEIAAVLPANVGSNIRDHGASCRHVPPDGMKEILSSSASQLCPQLVGYVLAKYCLHR